jgi:predicted MFS family arabinose efflux permease
VCHGSVTGATSIARVKRLLVLLGAIVLVDTLFYSTLAPLLPHYEDVAGLTKTQAGVLTAAFGAGTLLGAIPAGLLAARRGVKPTILLGLGLLASTSLIFGFAEQLWLLDLARFAQGVACTWTATLAWLVAVSPPERRGELIGGVLGVAIGGALFGPALGALAANVGTEWVFGAIGLLIGALALVVLLRETPPRGEPRPMRTLLAQLRRPDTLTGMWLIALPAALFGILSVLAPLRLDHLGWGATAIGATFLVSAGFEAGLSPVFGRLFDRLGPAIVPPAIAGSAMVTALLPLPPWAWLVALLVVAAGIVYGMFWVPAMASLSHGAEASGLDQSFSFALMNLAWAAGQTVGSTAGGAAGNAFGDVVPYWSAALLCLATLAAPGLTRGARAAYSESP